jgi:hypothetical protein
LFEAVADRGVENGVADAHDDAADDVGLHRGGEIDLATGLLGDPVADLVHGGLIELDRKTVKEIGDRIAEQTGRKVDLSSTVEPEIIGGIVVRVGNSVLDASIRNRLENFRKQVARAS